jgi:UDP-N-acetylglucosamine diphosphorylase/glucosamine-1-phosphate N-acetyltransferase
VRIWFQATIYTFWVRETLFMGVHLCFFEDQKTVRFYPNALTRPIDQMRMGILTIAEKWENMLDIHHATRTLRPWLKGVFDSDRPLHGEDYIWINSRFIPHFKVISEVMALKSGEGLTCSGTPVVVRLDGDRTITEFDRQQDWMAAFETHLQNGGTSYPFQPITFDNVSYAETSNGLLLEHAWDLFQHNETQIVADLRQIRPTRTLNHWPLKNFFYVNPDQVYLEANVKLEPGIVLDASEGPIYLGEGAHIMAGALIKGPVAICAHSTVRMGAKIYGGTTAGPHCKLGGEVSSAIFQGYSNKAHDGYIGNSLIGEWVNIGADTNNSNLKNNYSSVKVFDWETGELKDTGLQFCGLFMADHSKTAINSMLNSGTVCGVSSSILTNNFPPKYIPSYGWVTDISIDVFDLDKALETARIVMGRRGLSMSEAYINMMRYLFTVRDGRA